MMATRLKGAKVDENAEENSKKGTKPRSTNVTTMAKRSALGELGNRALIKNNDIHKENTKYVETLKNVKPRVDTYWKKTDPQSYLKLSNRAHAAIYKPPVIDIKPQGIVKPKVKENEQQYAALPVHREESNVTRKSLAKLKAVLCKNEQEKAFGAVPPTKAFQLECNIVAHSASLIDEVENIDAGDANNPFLVSEYANDIYTYLFHMEAKISIRKDHLAQQTEVTPKMRAVLFDWINEVHYQFRLLPETYHLATGIIDRYLQEVPSTLRQQLQLVGVGALFIASKYEELYPPAIDDLVYIADDTYTKQEILAIEQKIIKKINYDVGRPSSIHFLRRFSKAANTNDENHMLGKYLIELVSIEYSLANYKPSKVAAASMFISLKLLNKKSNLTDYQLWTKSLEFYTTYTVEDLRPLIKSIALLIKNAPTAQLKAVYTKYQSSKFEKIAKKAELRGPILNELCN